MAEFIFIMLALSFSAVVGGVFLMAIDAVEHADYMSRKPREE